MTPKQQRFVEEYCANGGNGTKAAIVAGYSEKIARQIAAENITKPVISHAIDEFRAKNAAKAEVTVQSLTKQLQAIAEKHAETQPSAAVSALNTVAKMHGLLAEDRKNTRDPLTDAVEAVAAIEKEKRLH